MKLAVVCLLAFAVIVCVFARPQKYTTKYDNLNVDEILQNERLLKRYTDCVLEKQTTRCPPESIELKDRIIDALDTECEKCSDQQRKMVKKVIKFLVQNKPETWNELKTKYDPEGKYAKRYEEFARNEGVEV